MASARKLIGATDPLQAEPGTIRGDLAVQTGRFGFIRYLIADNCSTISIYLVSRIFFLLFLCRWVGFTFMSILTGM